MPELTYAFAVQIEKTRTLGMKTTCAAIQVIFIEIILMAELPLPFKGQMGSLGTKEKIP